jgi:hypothetical protein
MTSSELKQQTSPTVAKAGTAQQKPAHAMKYAFFRENHNR